MRADGRVVAAASEPTRLILHPGGGAEQDPADWWRAITTASRRVLDGSAWVDQVIGVACTGQWSGTVCVDAAGRHLGNALIWMDARGAALVRQRIRGLVRVEGYGVAKALRWIRLAGGAPEKSGKDPVAHILWLRQHRPDLYREAAAFLEPKDYVNARLTGRIAAGFDSIALHWSTDNRRADRVRYDRGLLALTGLDPAKLPPLHPPTDVLGPLLPDAAEMLGVRAGIPVVMGAPDMHTAAIGSGAVADFATHLYLGTSSWLLCHVPFKKTDVLRNMASLPAALPGRWLLVNEQETAGGCLAYLANTLGIRPVGLDSSADLAEVYRSYDRAAEQVPPGNSGMIFTPWLYGERTPVENASLRAGLHNMSLDSSREDVIRAVFEGVALNSRWLLGGVERFVRRRVDGIRMVGGGASSRVWCQIHADVMGRTVHQVRDPVLVNLRGAGLLGFLGLGRIEVRDLHRGGETAETFAPDPSATRTYDVLFREFLRLFRASRPVDERLHRLSGPPVNRSRRP